MFVKDGFVILFSRYFLSYGTVYLHEIWYILEYLYIFKWGKAQGVCDIPRLALQLELEIGFLNF